MSKEFDPVECCRAEIEGGNYRELMSVLLFASARREPIPDWLIRALGQVVNAAWTYQIKSWDDILGKPVKKHGRLEEKRRRAEIEFPLWERVQEAKQRGEPVDRGLFELVGREFRVSGALAEKIYYKTRELCEAMVRGGWGR
jgi:hypothetical protein